MATSKTEKRELKGYKIKDSLYEKAMNRAKREKRPLSQQIEKFVSDYAKPPKKFIPGPDVFLCPSNDNYLKIVVVDGKVDEIWTRSIGDAGWTVIGKEDLDEAIRQALKK